MTQEIQTLQLAPNYFVGIIIITFLALILMFLVVRSLSKKQEWTSKKRGFFIGGIICLILIINIVLGMFSYYGSCTKLFVDSELCGQYEALVYPANIIFALICGVPAFLIGGLVGWIVEKMKSKNVE